MTASSCKSLERLLLALTADPVLRWSMSWPCGPGRSGRSQRYASAAMVAVLSGVAFTVGFMAGRPPPTTVLPAGPERCPTVDAAAAQPCPEWPSDRRPAWPDLERRTEAHLDLLAAIADCPGAEAVVDCAEPPCIVYERAVETGHSRLRECARRFRGGSRGMRRGEGFWWAHVMVGPDGDPNPESTRLRQLDGLIRWADE